MRKFFTEFGQAQAYANSLPPTVVHGKPLYFKVREYRCGKCDNITFAAGPYGPRQRDVDYCAHRVESEFGPRDCDSTYLLRTS